MIRINLLDWRAERREIRQKQFTYTVALVAGVSAGIVFLSLTLANSALEYQKKRNDFLKAQISEIDAQIKEIDELEKVKSNLIARMEVIQKLQGNRAEVVHYFDEIVDTLPDGTFLTSLKQTGGATTIAGTAESNGRISEYMKAFDASDWFSNPNLVVIKVKETGLLRLSTFEMKVTSQVPKNSAADGVDGSMEDSIEEVVE